MKRRDLLVLSIGSAFGFAASKWYLNYENNKIPITINYPGMSDGHAIRNKDKLMKEKESSDIINLESDVVIVGSGIAGLTACWKLIKSNYKGKITLVTGGELFGNSSDKKINNEYYPIGAHYLPLQNEESIYTKEILKFFNIIKDGENLKEPLYNEKYLVHSPKERVLIDKEWIDGIYRINDVSKSFFETINTLKRKKGSDGKFIFAIPLSLSSSDNLGLDEISFKDWLIKNDFYDKDLIEHLNYCCKDDYGVTIEYVSAWAGIHYFAGRCGKGKGIDFDTLLTWKNGNAFLAKSMFNYIKDKISVIDGSVFEINKNNNIKKVLLKDFKNNKFLNIDCNKVILTTPLNITNKILNNQLKKEIVPDHSLWIVSSVLFKELPKEIYNGVTLSYDNVIYGSKNLGYIYSGGQSLDISIENKVLTTYLTLNELSPKEERQRVFTLSKKEMIDLVLNDLVKSYGNKVYDYIESIDVNVRGHAMPYPSVGFLKRNQELKTIMTDLEKDKIYLAHSDLSGISIFEEASYWGYSAGIKVLDNKEL